MADITGLISISLFLKELQKSECKILPSRWGELRDPFYTYLYWCVCSWDIRDPKIGPSWLDLMSCPSTLLDLEQLLYSPQN